MVPKAGLEPARLSPLPPQDSVSTNSTTWAFHSHISFFYNSLVHSTRHATRGRYRRPAYRDTWAPARRLPIPPLGHFILIYRSFITHWYIQPVTLRVVATGVLPIATLELLPGVYQFHHLGISQTILTFTTEGFPTLLQCSPLQEDLSPALAQQE